LMALRNMMHCSMNWLFDNHPRLPGNTLA
jgi:hypothetical protein